MLWFKKQPNTEATGVGAEETVTPISLADHAVELDARVFSQKFATLLETIGEAGGVDSYLVALANKTQLFQRLLNAPAIDDLNFVKIELLLETIMPARKRLWPALQTMGEAAAVAAIRELLYGHEPLAQRLPQFVAAVPNDPHADNKTNKKLKRAAHDFAAEMLHFRAPEQYPLMTRWVWDAGTLSGALREMMKGGDTLNHIPIGASPGVYEAGRVWVAEQLATQGVYREPHYVVDLFLAHAYADYMRAMSNGMGLMNADFGGKADPMEVVKKLLGIDSARSKASRVKKLSVH